MNISKKFLTITAAAALSAIALTGCMPSGNNNTPEPVKTSASASAKATDGNMTTPDKGTETDKGTDTSTTTNEAQDVADSAASFINTAMDEDTFKQYLAIVDANGGSITSEDLQNKPELLSKLSDVLTMPISYVNTGKYSKGAATAFVAGFMNGVGKDRPAGSYFMTASPKAVTIVDATHAKIDIFDGAVISIDGVDRTAHSPGNILPMVKDTATNNWNIDLGNMVDQAS